MNSRLKKKRPDGQKKQDPKPANHSQKRKLYEALLSIYGFYHLEDFLFLKSDYFLKLCGAEAIDWIFNKSWLERDFLKAKTEQNGAFQMASPLDYKTNHYGELIFFSSHKFSQNQKIFLKKIAFFAASALYFIENKEKMENIKRQWGGAFDSFSQAFCITDNNLKIIRSNQSFQKISGRGKRERSSKSLFDVFPIPEKISTQEEGSWLTKEEKDGQQLFWEISFKPLFLKKEKIQALLFLIKNVTEEIRIEAKLSAQAKKRELGLIKGSIAHELNNPIAGVKALLSIIEKHISPREILIKDSLKEMQKAIDRCHQVIQHLLFVSQNSKKD